MKTALALVTLVALTTAAAAQVARVDSFRGTLVNVAGQDGRPLSVDLVRWSTDAERDKVTATAAKGDTALLDVLKGMPTLGYVWTGESVGYQVRYAFRATLPNGGERIIVATDRPVGSYALSPWKPAPPAAATDYAFTVIEMRLPKGGAGEAKTSLAAKITTDAAAKTLALDNYAAAPVIVKNVRRP
jgi:opacity protein-like surface antigen